jgi:regulator of protease activity HflC (stomatin/prohibitin superfamily)
MPALFVLAIVFAIFTLICLATALATKKHKGTTTSYGEMAGGAVAHVVSWVLVGVFGLAIVLSVFFSSFNSVGTYDTGVTTSFGKVISYVGPGAHFIPPYENMALMDESVQTIDDTLTVRVAGQQTAQADVKLRVQLIPSATDSLFKQYKGNTQNVITALVKPELNVAMNGVYDGYDPILPLSTGAKAGTPDNPTTQQLSNAVKAALTAAIGSQVKVNTLIVQPLKYDQTVENRINSVLAQTAKTDVAKQAEITAQAQAAANNTIQASLAQNPLVIANNCVNGLIDGQITNEPGFSCYPTSGSSVVIPAAGK